MALRVHIHTCIDCGATVAHEMHWKQAIAESRLLGWQWTTGRRWHCPEHRTVPRPDDRRGHIHECIECARFITQEARRKDEAEKASRAAGWQLRHSGEWLCPDHRTVALFAKVAPQKGNTAAPMARLSLSFLERQAQTDAEYARRMAERKARDEALKEVVFAQGRRQLTPEQERAVSGRNRQVIGFRNAARGAA